MPTADEGADWCALIIMTRLHHVPHARFGQRFFLGIALREFCTMVVEVLRTPPLRRWGAHGSLKREMYPMSPCLRHRHSRTTLALTILSPFFVHIVARSHIFRYTAL